MTASGDTVRPLRAPASLPAAPGYLYRVPACIPWWSARTHAAIVRAVLRGQIVEGPATARLARRLAGLLGPVLPTGSGRVAIELALRAGGVGPGAEVVVPTFCCRSVLGPILAVGARPVLADVGPELALTPDTLLAAIGPRTRAVIVPHLFGNPAPIDRILPLARSRDLLVVDDAAQALGGELAGRPLGTWGDAGVISFGNGKVCFGTGGGVLISHREDLLARAAAVPLARASVGEGLRNALAVTVRRRWRRWTLPGLVALSRIGWTPLPQAAPRAGRAIRDIDAAVALTLLDTLPENLRARRQRVASYREQLDDAAGVHLIPHRAGSACLSQVIRVTRRGRSGRDVIRALRMGGIEAGASFTPLHLLPRYRELAATPLPEAERVWGDLVELPTEPSVPVESTASAARLIVAATA